MTFFLVLFFGFQNSDAGNLVVVPLAPEAINMKGEELIAAGKGQRRFVFVGDRIVANRECASGLAGRGHAVIDDVDDTANGARAVKQGGRAAQNFNLLGGHRLGGNNVVRANPGCIADIQAVLGDQHPWAVQAANNRGAGYRAEVAGVNTHFVFQRFAEGGCLLTAKFFAADNGNRLSRFHYRDVQWQTHNINLLNG